LLRFADKSRPLLFVTIFFLLATAVAQEKPDFAPVDDTINKAVAGGEIPGAVVLIGHDGKVVYRKAYGHRTLGPNPEPMTPDTIFDMASLTKVIATAPSVMRLVEKGQVKLNDPVARYIPEFAQNGKQDITVRMLLTHFSGLPPDLDLTRNWNGSGAAIQMACASPLIAPPGSRFIYSDINFIVLGELVRRVSTLPIDRYSEAHIFRALNMDHTRYLPSRDWQPRIAPTGFRGEILRGVPQDPTARRMGNVAGHAGLFSTADDLSKFAQAILDGKFILSPATVEKMTTPQQPPTSTVLRGLGWDIDSPLSSNRGELLPVGSFGHTGYAGTSLWIDPTTKTYIVLLVNEIKPDSGSTVVSLRTRVATAVTAALDLQPSQDALLRMQRITGYNERMAGARVIGFRNGNVLTGIDVLEQNGFKPLAGTAADPKRIALLTNQTGLDRDGRRTIDVLAHADGIKLVSIMTPEHGMEGKVDVPNVPDGTDTATGLPVYSLYRPGRRGRPTPELLKDVEAIVVDLQDVGVRFYSYEVMLGYTLEDAQKAGVEIVVLDRPVPLTGSLVQGPVSTGGSDRLINYIPLPVRHGMTLGELARMFNGERRIGAKLTVVPMQGWLRGDWWDSTGLPWIAPSPALQTFEETILYPGVALIEGTNISVGRGTATPFEVVGAPWVKARDLAQALNERRISGVRFVPVSFTPTEGPYKGELCQGVNLVLTDRNALDAPELGIELASALRRLYPNDWKSDKMPLILENPATYQALVAGEDPRRIADDWRDDIDAFLTRREAYLLYH
jgi:uncharacterized protein YbbC (DUF1343 family)/CubicO group peptidase (beta-lactamase class C family)